LATIVVMTWASVWGYQHGDVNRLTAPINGNHEFCGSDKVVKDFPKMYLFDMSPHDIVGIFKSGVCVKVCPMKGNIFKKDADFYSTKVVKEA